MELLAGRGEPGTTVLAALHDLTLAARFASRVIVLDGGRIAADGAPRAGARRRRCSADVFGVARPAPRARGRAGAGALVTTGRFAQVTRPARPWQWGIIPFV